LTKKNKPVDFLLHKLGRNALGKDDFKNKFLKFNLLA
jgi:hypothetical protein